MEIRYSCTMHRFILFVLFLLPLASLSACDCVWNGDFFAHPCDSLIVRARVVDFHNQYQTNANEGHPEIMELEITETFRGKQNLKNVLVFYGLTLCDNAKHWKVGKEYYFKLNPMKGTYVGLGPRVFEDAVYILFGGACMEVDCGLNDGKVRSLYGNDYTKLEWVLYDQAEFVERLRTAIHKITP